MLCADSIEYNTTNSAFFFSAQAAGGADGFSSMGETTDVLS